ncbi:hypothetical protein WN944_019874 [Citrus x changshan-huyou]|uniref:Adaptor protein ClpS core domain-containing protein n=1 Tax=Citrus x changshan-huyou TaxID=2935761 RepID=A0AAP0LXI5_9ROSI
METAICGRLALSPHTVFNSKPAGDKSLLCRGSCINRSVLMTVLASAPGKGGGLLERPVITAPGRESEFDLKNMSKTALQGSRFYKTSAGKKRKTSPPYRVILHNDNFNKREYVVQVLMKVIPGMTLDNAVNIMQEAHYNGLSVVIICSQADAEEHCMQLRGNGLLSSIEPASGGC